MINNIRIKQNKKETSLWEVKVIDKVRAFTDKAFPDEKKRAIAIFKKKHRDEIINASSPKDVAIFFFYHFLLEHKLPNGMTQMAFALSKGKNFFTEKEKAMIYNFICSENSFFEVKNISKNKKDYLLLNIIDNKEYLVKTIDFRGKLNISDFIVARIVKKLNGDYFFCGPSNSYDKEEGQKMKDDILKKTSL